MVARLLESIPEIRKNEFKHCWYVWRMTDAPKLNGSLMKRLLVAPGFLTKRQAVELVIRLVDVESLTRARCR